MNASSSDTSPTPPARRSPSDRHAVVTGASRGIGRAITHHLAACGLQVTAMGRDAAALEETMGTTQGRISTRICDVADPVSVVEAFADLGPVDVLVNNAGVASSAPVHRIELDDWEWLLRVNSTGPLLCIRQVLPGMVDRDHGRIVTVASVAAHRGGRYIGAYAASKHAVLGLMRALAAEVAGSGVTANTVCPGYVRTPMTEATVANIVARTGRTADIALEQLVGATGLGRLIEPEEVAAAVGYLVSDAAAAVNGQSVVIDGGDLQQ